MIKQQCEFLVTEAADGSSRRRVTVQVGSPRLLAGSLVSAGPIDGEVRAYGGEAPVVGILLFDAGAGEEADIITGQATVIQAKLTGLDRAALRDLGRLGVLVW